VDTLTHWQRVGIVVELNLLLAGLALVNSAHGRILVVHPRPLHIGLLLWVEVLAVDLADEVGDFLDSHLLEWTDLSTSLVSLISVELLHSASCISDWFISKVVSVLSAEVASILVGTLAGNDRTKAGVCRLHGSIDEGKLSDVVLVDHAEDGLLLLMVDLGVLDLLLVRGLQLAEGIVRDETERLLLWLAVDGSKGCWDTRGRQTVQVWLFLTFL